MKDIIITTILMLAIVTSSIAAIATVIILSLTPTSSIAAESLGTYPLGTWPASAPAETYTQVFADAFTRADTGDVATGGSWTSETDTGLLNIVSNTMQWGPSAAITPGYITKDFGAAYLKSKTEVDVKISTLTTSSGGYIQFLQTRNNSNAISATVQVKATGTTINQVALIWYDEAGAATTASQSFTFSADTSYTFTLESSAATGASANDGTLTLSINGTPVITLTGLDTYGKSARYARVGMLYLPLAGTTRTLTFDNFYFGENDA